MAAEKAIHLPLLLNLEHRQAGARHFWRGSKEDKAARLNFGQLDAEQPVVRTREEPLLVDRIEHIQQRLGDV